MGCGSSQATQVTEVDQGGSPEGRTTSVKLISDLSSVDSIDKAGTDLATSKVAEQGIEMGDRSGDEAVSNGDEKFFGELGATRSGEVF